MVHVRESAHQSKFWWHRLSCSGNNSVTSEGPAPVSDPGLPGNSYGLRSNTRSQRGAVLLGPREVLK